MKSSITTDELIYNSVRARAYASKNYEQTRQCRHLLHEPLFPLQVSQSIVEDLTYRKVNDWDSKNLISGSRDNKEAGWRKFSIIDTLKLQLISDLKKFGFSSDKIRRLLHKISHSSVELQNNKTNRLEDVEFFEFEYYFFAAMSGQKIIMIVDAEENACFFTEEHLVVDRFSFGNFSSPALLLPFFSYVQNISTALRKDIRIKKETTIEELFRNLPTEQERKILELIRTQDYEELKIKRNDGKEVIITAKTRQRGAFSDKDIITAINSKNYQTVSVARVGGEVLSIVREETMKA